MIPFESKPPHPWRPILEPILGPGQSRPIEGQRTRAYTLVVKQERDCTPFRLTLKAPSENEAIRYAMNRWPNCTATVVK
jgi:hypothetical protein